MLIYSKIIASNFFVFTWHLHINLTLLGQLPYPSYLKFLGQLASPSQLILPGYLPSPSDLIFLGQLPSPYPFNTPWWVVESKYLTFLSKVFTNHIYNHLISYSNFRIQTKIANFQIKPPCPKTFFFARGTTQMAIKYRLTTKKRDHIVGNLLR